MAVPVFPTLTAKSEVKNYSHQPLIDPVRKVKFDSGAILTRTLFTDIPVRYSVFYEAITDAEQQTLEAWERDSIEYGEKQFNWTNPKNSKTYLTVLLSPIKYKIQPRSSGVISELRWTVSFNLATLSEVI